MRTTFPEENGVSATHDTLLTQETPEKAVKFPMRIKNGGKALGDHLQTKRRLPQLPDFALQKPAEITLVANLGDRHDGVTPTGLGEF